MPDNPTNSDNAYYGRQALPLVMPDPVPNRGPSTDPNPGERSAAADAQGAPINSLGLIPSRGNRAGGGRQIDVGARVGIMRSLEFSAGGRAHRLSTGTFSGAAPVYDPKTGLLHISSASENADPNIGPLSGNEGQRAEPPRVDGVGAVNDTTAAGETGPGRRRDTKTP